MPYWNWQTFTALCAANGLCHQCVLSASAAPSPSRNDISHSSLHLSWESIAPCDGVAVSLLVLHLILAAAFIEQQAVPLTVQTACPHGRKHTKMEPCGFLGWRLQQPQQHLSTAGHCVCASGIMGCRSHKAVLLQVLCGVENGSLLMWSGGLIKFVVRQSQEVPCHQGAVTVVLAEHNRKRILTAGTDG